MLTFLNALPGAVSQGLIWGVMAIGVYLTYKILDIADLTVDGSFCTGGAVFVMLFTAGAGVWPAMLAALLAGMLAGLVTGLFLRFLLAELLFNSRYKVKAGYNQADENQN